MQENAETIMPILDPPEAGARSAYSMGTLIPWRDADCVQEGPGDLHASRDSRSQATSVAQGREILPGSQTEPRYVLSRSNPILPSGRLDVTVVLEGNRTLRGGLSLKVFRLRSG